MFLGIVLKADNFSNAASYSEIIFQLFCLDVCAKMLLDICQSVNHFKVKTELQ